MENTWQTRRIGDIVGAYPRAAEAFKAWNIDYCCGGQRLLGDALAELGGRGGEVYAYLDRLSAEQAERAGDRGVAGMAPGDLVNHIQEKHHAYLREALPEIGGVFSAVLKAHGAKHRELFPLHSLFGRLRTDLEQHLVKEEVLLFPALVKEMTTDTAVLAGEIVEEHERAGDVLKRMRALARDWAAPRDACGTYRRLFADLMDLEDDLFRHIHLENNILLRDIARKGGIENG